MLAFTAPGPIELIVIAFMALVIILPFWKSVSKAGFNGALSLLMVIPVLNFIMILFLAFAEWPVLKESPRLEEHPEMQP